MFQVISFNRSIDWFDDDDEDTVALKDFEETLAVLLGWVEYKFVFYF